MHFSAACLHENVYIYFCGIFVNFNAAYCMTVMFILFYFIIFVVFSFISIQYVCMTVVTYFPLVPFILLDLF